MSAHCLSLGPGFIANLKTVATLLFACKVSLHTTTALQNSEYDFATCFSSPTFSFLSLPPVDRKLFGAWRRTIWRKIRSSGSAFSRMAPSLFCQDPLRLSLQPSLFLRLLQLSLLQSLQPSLLQSLRLFLLQSLDQSLVLPADRSPLTHPSVS